MMPDWQALGKLAGSPSIFALGRSHMRCRKRVQRITSRATERIAEALEFVDIAGLGLCKSSTQKG